MRDPCRLPEHTKTYGLAIRLSEIAQKSGMGRGDPPKWTREGVMWTTKNEIWKEKKTPKEEKEDPRQTRHLYCAPPPSHPRPSPFLPLPPSL